MTDIAHNSDTKQFSFSSGKYSFSFRNSGPVLTSLCVPDRNGNTLNVILPVDEPCIQNIVSDALNDDFCKKLWFTKKQRDGYSCFSETAFMLDDTQYTFNIESRFSLTQSGVFSIHHRAWCTGNYLLNIKNRLFFNLSGDSVSSEDCKVKFYDTGLLEKDVSSVCNQNCVIERLFGEKRGFKRFATLYSYETGVRISCYTDLCSYSLTGIDNYNGNRYAGGNAFCIETELNSEYSYLKLVPGEMFESTTSFAFDLVS